VALRAFYAQRVRGHGPTAANLDRAQYREETTMSVPELAAWHEVLASGDPVSLRALLAEDACFHSPVVHRPQQGRELTALYLGAAFRVFAGTDFRYVREIASDTDAALEFTATIDGIVVNGVDLIHWNAEGRISDFKVMVRPLKGIEKIREKMAAMLESM
jgi:hypothetical protein